MCNNNLVVSLNTLTYFIASPSNMATYRVWRDEAPWKASLQNWARIQMNTKSCSPRTTTCCCSIHVNILENDWTRGPRTRSLLIGPSSQHQRVCVRHWLKIKSGGASRAVRGSTCQAAGCCCCVRVCASLHVRNTSVSFARCTKRTKCGSSASRLCSCSSPAQVGSSFVLLSPMQTLHLKDVMEI